MSRLPAFGCVVRVPSPEAVAGIAEAAEVAGFALLGIGDSQSLSGDTYVHQANAGRSSRSLRIGPCVTNVVTRHVAVTAAAIQTIDQLTAGRAFLGLSVGDSAVLNLGLRPATIAQLEDAVGTIRRLLAGERVDHGQGTMHSAWSPRPVPIFLAAEGPRAVALAGRVADGVFLGTGLTPSALDAAAEWLSAGLTDRETGLGDLEQWHMARLGVGDDRDAAVHALRPALASIAHHGLSSSLEHKRVPPEIVPALEELRRRYDTSHHVEPGDSPNAMLVDELGLSSYLVERFAVVGTPDDCAQQVLALRNAGVKNLLFTITDADPAATLHRWHSEVSPRLNALTGTTDGEPRA